MIKSLTNNIYYYQDGLGSTTHIADGSGNLLESYRYDLYGTPSYYDQNGQPKTNQVSAYGVNDLYVGERWVSELRVYDLRNRFMSSELGRFLQPDSIGFKGDASNLYRYCHNDSVDRVDPLGFTDLCYVGGYTEADWRIRDALDKTINPKEVISVGAHASPTEMRNTTVKPSVPLTVKQVVQDIRNLDKFKNNPNMPVRLYMCRAGDWKTAVAEHKSSPAQDIANESGRKVQATGAWLNPESKTKWPTDTCPNTTWYEFSPNAAEPKRIEDPTGFRKGGLSNGGSLGDSESKRDTRPTYDAYGSTTTAAAAWEASWEYGGWLTADRNLGR